MEQQKSLKRLTDLQWDVLEYFKNFPHGFSLGKQNTPFARTVSLLS